jgi:hypothetical protein
VSAVLDEALALWGRGFSLIPIPRADGSRFDGKTPAIPWRKYQTRRAPEDQIRSWFSGPPRNIAIITGALSGVVVVDCDSPCPRRAGACADAQ